MQSAREAGATAEVDVQAALDWRDFMVSNYSDTAAAQWLEDRGIALLRGRGRLAGTGAVEIEGVRYTADHVVLANGADPIVPPVPGLRELDGVWGTNDATGMKAVPTRLIVLGGGPAGLELSQVVRRLGGEVALVEAAEHVLAREPAPLGEALGEALRRDGIELVLGVHATSASRDGEDFVLGLEDGRELRGDHLLVATGRRPRVEGIGLETVGITAAASGIPVDSRMRAGERLWALGDVTGIWQLTHVGEYQGEVVASNILGEPREACYDAVPRVTYTDPQAAAVGATEGRFSATARLAEIAKTATYTHAYAESNGFLTLLSDGEQLTGAYALGPRPGNGCSRRRWRSAPAFRSTCSATPSSRSPASRRSMPRRSRRSDARWPRQTTRSGRRHDERDRRTEISRRPRSTAGAAASESVATSTSLAGANHRRNHDDHRCRPHPA